MAKNEVSFKSALDNMRADQWSVFTYLAINFNETFPLKSLTKTYEVYIYKTPKSHWSSVSQKVTSIDAVPKLLQWESNGSNSL